MQFFPPTKNLQTSGAPWVSCGILEFSFSMRGRGEGGRGFAIDPHVPFACFLSSIPKKESKPGMDGTLMSFSLRSIPPGVLSQFTSCPAPGVPLPGFPTGRCMFCALQRDSAQIWVPVPESHGSCWCCERGVPPTHRDSGVPPVTPGPSAAMGSDSGDI